MNLSWTSGITILVKKALMLLYFSGQNSLAKLFYRGVTGSIMTSNITNWAVRDRTWRLCRGWLKLPRTSVVHIDQAPGYISEVRCWHRSQDTPKESTQPSHNLFTLLPQAPRLLHSSFALQYKNIFSFCFVSSIKGPHLAFCRRKW